MVKVFGKEKNFESQDERFAETQKVIDKLTPYLLAVKQSGKEVTLDDVRDALIVNKQDASQRTRQSVLRRFNLAHP